MADGQFVFDGSGSDLSADIVEKIYGMQVKRAMNYRGNQEKIQEDDTPGHEIEKDGNTIALFRNDKDEERIEKAVSGRLI